LRLDEAIFALAQDRSHRSVQRVLIGVGDVAAYLASSPKSRDPKEGKQKPPPRLSRGWYYAADDGTAEFCIAAALAGLGRQSHTNVDADDQYDTSEEVDETTAEAVGESEEEAAGRAAAITEEIRARRIPPPPFRAHLAPLDEGSWYGRHRSWSEQNRLVVWGTGALERNMTAVLERRLLFATQHNLDGSPFDARLPANLASVLAFLGYETDNVKIGALVKGLAWAELPNVIRAVPAEHILLPLSYALLKPFFAPVRDLLELGVLREGTALPIPPGVVSRLRAGDVGSAVALACQRARASGLPVTFKPAAEHVMTGIDGSRLLASLLIPLRASDLRRLLERAYPALFDKTVTPETEEKPANAA
jgi:CRISPR-associated protein Csx17